MQINFVKVEHFIAAWPLIYVDYELWVASLRTSSKLVPFTCPKLESVIYMDCW